MKRLMKWLLVSCASCLGFPSGARADDPGRTVDIWVRTPGLYAEGREHPKEHHKRLDLDKQKLVSVRRHDFQYGEQMWFRGLQLEAILDSYPHQKGHDLLLMHFSNGMIIPVPVDDGRATIKSLNIFIARSQKTDRREKWSKAFPEVAKQDPTFRYKDPMPVAFTGNKVVVSKGLLPGNRSNTFSPWRHAASLTGLEFVQRSAWEDQFLVRGVEVTDPGFQTYMGRCSYCHGIGKIGASHGWDFLGPVPLYQLKRAEHVYNKLKYPYHDALERGLQMPVQPNVSEAEVEALWKWLKITGKGSLGSYTPQ